MASLASTLYFGLCAFMGNLVFSAMGFGVGIIFLFVYQLGSLAGLMDCCNLRYAVFVLTLGFCIILPLVLWHTNLRQHARIDFLVYFVPVQFIGTPIGQFLQNKMPTSILKLIVGIVTGGVAIWQIYSIYRETRKRKKRKGAVDENTPYLSLPTAENGTYANTELQIQHRSVFFAVGSSYYENLDYLEGIPNVASPPSTPLLSSFLPIVTNFGDLKSERNLLSLIEHMCCFAEKNPVPWTSFDGTPITFDREKITKFCKGNSPSIFTILEAMLNKYAEANNCSSWIYKLHGGNLPHEAMLQHFGASLRYIYLVQDPRAVCKSTKIPHADDMNVFVLAEKWNKLHNKAVEALSDSPEIVFQLEYDSFVNHESEESDKLLKFIKDEKDLETQLQSSSQVVWKNLVLSDCENEQLNSRWRNRGIISDLELKMVEHHCFDTMKKLGYQPLLSKENLKFEENEVIEFYQQNEVKKQEQRARRRRDSPDDVAKETTQKDIIDKFRTLDRHEIEGNCLVRFMWKVKGEVLPVRAVFIWMMVAGFFSGFFGGLIGVRGPPLIMFFFFFEYPKKQVKANGSIIATANTLIRVLTYAVTKPPETYIAGEWFVKSEWSVYVTVLILGLAGSPCGIYLSRYLNRGGYKIALAALLIVNGLTMMITASLDLINDKT